MGRRASKAEACDSECGFDNGQQAEKIQEFSTKCDQGKQNLVCEDDRIQNNSFLIP